MKATSRRTCLCAGLGFCTGGLCLLVSVALLIVPQVVIGNLVSSIEGYLVKLMFIDNVNSTAKQGPQAGALSDRQQFEEFMSTPQQAYQDCIDENKDDASTCNLGVGVSVGIFNVTNPEAVALNGEKPDLMELGPVRVRLLSVRSDVDVSFWNQEGVARFKQDTKYVLDEKLCDASCHKLLASKVVVVNPIWAVLGWTGREKVVLFAGVASKLGTMRTVVVQVLLRRTFGLQESSERAAFSEAFIAASLSMDEIQANMGTFLVSASKAQNTTDTCAIGSLAVSAQTCGSVVAGFQSLLNQGWPETLSQYEARYGVGAAMPLFIQVTVSQALGLNGAEIFDPLTGQNASYMVLADKLAVPQEVQMSSQFGAQGVGYSVGMDCSVDPSCKLDKSGSMNTCTVSDTCSPRSLNGFGVQVPGRAFGQGFPQWTMMGAQANFTLGPVPVPYAVVDTRAQEVVLEGGQKQTMDYVRFEPKGWLRQLHDCSSGQELSRTAGRDCNGPSNTLLLTREQPMYLSAPFFGSSVFQNISSMNEAQLQVPFEPSDRVTMSPCAGSQWCDDSDRFHWFLNVEPETGRLFDARVVFQLNARIGMGKHMPSVFNVSESLVPIAWEVIEQTASSAQLALLVQAQNAPASLLGLRGWFLAGGICLVVLSLACCGCGMGVMLCHRQTGERSDLTPKDNTEENASREGNDTV